MLSINDILGLFLYILYKYIIGSVGSDNVTLIPKSNRKSELNTFKNKSICV